MKTALLGLTRCQGRLGQLSFILQGLAGLGTLAILIIRIPETSTIYFFPSLREEALNFHRGHTLSKPGLAGLRFLATWVGLRTGRERLAPGKL